MLSVQLAPNAGATPMGSYYTAVYHLDDGSVSREYWVVPPSAGAVNVSAIEEHGAAYFGRDADREQKLCGHGDCSGGDGHPLDSSTPYVLKAGDTMTGPLVLPGDPTSPTQAADKHYVDTNVTALASGLAQKVATLPAATQTVAQPAGTHLRRTI